MSIVVGISGPSSSGKTTLARALKSIFLSAGHRAFILHEDDFYVTDADIPIHQGTGLQDWDCIEAVDQSALVSALKYIKEKGELPPNLHSKEDQNSVGKSTLNEETVAQIRGKAVALKLSPRASIAIIDGFLLFTPQLVAAYSLMDVRIFLPTTRELMIKRRSARTGYVTLEGFWEDPPGYVEKVVWPNYVKDHAFLFQDGDVEGELKHDRVAQLELQVAPVSTMQDMNGCLRWAWDVIENYCSKTS